MGLDHIKDLTPDPKNARRHSSRGIATIVDGLHQVGAARSIVIDEDGVILAGNGAVEAAAQAGITRVRVVQADGNEIIAVQRKGLTKKQKQLLALYDNRTSELSEWNKDVIQQLANEGLDLHGLWGKGELTLLGDAPLALDKDDDAKVPPPPTPEVSAKEGLESHTLWYTQDENALFLRLLKRVAADTEIEDVSKAILHVLKRTYGE